MCTCLKQDILAHCDKLRAKYFGQNFTLVRRGRDPHHPLLLIGVPLYIIIYGGGFQVLPKQNQLLESNFNKYYHVWY